MFGRGDLLAEPGKNHTLEETFAIARGQEARVSMWGPYEIGAEWYTKAAGQVARLENGEVRYRVLDSIGLNTTVAHCVRAITSSDTIRIWRIQPVLQIGEPGTSRLAAHYVREGVFVGGPVTHDWLIPVVGADQYPVVRRSPRRAHPQAVRSVEAARKNHRPGRRGPRRRCEESFRLVFRSRHALDPPVANLAVAGDVILERQERREVLVIQHERDVVEIERFPVV